MWPSDQEAPHQSLCSDTNLASATLWLLFKLAYTQGRALPVNIKSWHNSLKQTRRDRRKIAYKMNIRRSFGLNCHYSNLWHIWPDKVSNTCEELMENGWEAPIFISLNKTYWALLSAKTQPRLMHKKRGPWLFEGAGVRRFLGIVKTVTVITLAASSSIAVLVTVPSVNCDYSVKLYITISLSGSSLTPTSQAPLEIPIFSSQKQVSKAEVKRPCCARLTFLFFWFPWSLQRSDAL